MLRQKQVTVSIDSDDDQDAFGHLESSPKALGSFQNVPVARGAQNRGLNLPLPSPVLSTDTTPSLGRSSRDTARDVWTRATTPEDVQRGFPPEVSYSPTFHPHVFESKDAVSRPKQQPSSVQNVLHKRQHSYSSPYNALQHTFFPVPVEKAIPVDKAIQTHRSAVDRTSKPSSGVCSASENQVPSHRKESHDLLESRGPSELQAYGRIGKQLPEKQKTSVDPSQSLPRSVPRMAKRPLEAEENVPRNETPRSRLISTAPLGGVPDEKRNIPSKRQNVSDENKDPSLAHAKPIASEKAISFEQSVEMLLSDAAKDCRAAAAKNLARDGQLFFCHVWLNIFYMEKPEAKISRSQIYNEYNAVCGHFKVQATTAILAFAIRAHFQSARIIQAEHDSGDQFYICGIAPKHPAIAFHSATKDPGPPLSVPQPLAMVPYGQDGSPSAGSRSLPTHPAVTELSADSAIQQLSQASETTLPSTTMSNEGRNPQTIRLPQTTSGSRAHLMTPNEMSQALHQVSQSDPSSQSNPFSDVSLKTVLSRLPLPNAIYVEVCRLHVGHPLIQTLSHSSLERAWALLLEHAGSLLDAIQELNFLLFETLQRNFWSWLTLDLRDALTHPVASVFTHYVDMLVYDTVLEHLQRVILHVEPSTLAYIFDFSSRMEAMTLSMYTGYANSFVKSKVALNLRFSHLLLYTAETCFISRGQESLLSDPFKRTALAESLASISKEAILYHISLMFPINMSIIANLIQDLCVLFASGSFSFNSALRWMHTAFFRFLNSQMSIQPVQFASIRSIVEQWQVLFAAVLRQAMLHNSPAIPELAHIFSVFTDVVTINILRREAFRVGFLVVHSPALDPIASALFVIENQKRAKDQQKKV